MPCRPGVGDGTVGKRQRLIDSAKHPKRDSIENFRGGARILAEPIGKIAMPFPAVEIDRLLKMIMGSSEVAEIPAGDAGNTMSDQSLGVTRPGVRFAQEQLRHVAHRHPFAAREMPHPKTVIGGQPFRQVFDAAR
jgi:hypothetical protein